MDKLFLLTYKSNRQPFRDYRIVKACSQIQWALKILRTKVLNVRPATLKYLGENLGETLQNLGTYHDFFFFLAC
jgi:hypothetical protein